VSWRPFLRNRGLVGHRIPSFCVSIIRYVPLYCRITSACAVDPWVGERRRMYLPFRPGRPGTAVNHSETAPLIELKVLRSMGARAVTRRGHIAPVESNLHVRDTWSYDPLPDQPRGQYCAPACQAEDVSSVRLLAWVIRDRAESYLDRFGCPGAEQPRDTLYHMILLLLGLCGQLHICQLGPIRISLIGSVCCEFLRKSTTGTSLRPLSRKSTSSAVANFNKRNSSSGRNPRVS